MPIFSAYISRAFISSWDAPANVAPAVTLLLMIAPVFNEYIYFSSSMVLILTSPSISITCPPIIPSVPEEPAIILSAFIAFWLFKLIAAANPISKALLSSPSPASIAVASPNFL